MHDMTEHRETNRTEEVRIRLAYAKRQEGDLYSWFQPGHVLIMQERERRMLAVFNRFGFANLSAKTVLEIGCGGGYWLRELVKWGARPSNITGIDLIADRLSTARMLCPGAVRLECASAAELPFRSESFDVVLQSTVFTSILDDELRRRVAAEMVRVLKPQGIIVWYDFHVNNPRNPDVRGVKRREIHQLFLDCRIELERITLVPPLTRALAPYSILACYLLEKISPLCTHYLGVITKR